MNGPHYQSQMFHVSVVLLLSYRSVKLIHNHHQMRKNRYLLDY